MLHCAGLAVLNTHNGAVAVNLMGNPAFRERLTSHFDAINPRLRELINKHLDENATISHEMEFCK